MKHLLRELVLSSLTFFWSGVCLAQVFQSGPVTTGHGAVWQLPNVVSDAGAASGVLSGQAQTEIGLMVPPGTGAAPWSASGTGPLGANDCNWDGPLGGPRHYLCFSPNVGGGAQILVGALGGATAGGLKFIVDGTTTNWPPAGAGNVVGPNSSVVGDWACWNSTVGTILKDCGVPLIGPSPSTAGAIAVWNNTAGTLLKDGAAAFPGSFGSTPTDYASVNIGSFPSSAEIPQGVLQGIVSKIIVPGTFAGTPWPNTAFSAYVKNANSVGGNSAVLYFGTSGLTAAGASGYGANYVMTNGTGLDAVSGQGRNFGVIEGTEIDTNIFKVGGAAPTGNLVGLMFAGASEVAPSAASFALQVRSLGTAIPWTTALQSQDGAASNAMEAGRTATGNNVGSQPIVFDATDNGGVQRQAIINADPAGDIVISSGSSAKLLVSIGLSNNHFIVTNSDIQAVDGTVRYGNAGAASPTIQYDGVNNVFDIFGPSSNTLLTLANGTIGAATTALSLRVNQSGVTSLQAVTLGAADSGGVGFRALRVPN